MTKATEALASAELERHEPKMLYAERQLWKAGEHERLAQSLARRTLQTIQRLKGMDEPAPPG